MKETKEESPLMKKLSKVLANKNDDYYITAAGSTISIYYCKCRLFEVVLDEINNPRFLSKGLIVKNSNAEYCLMNITPDKRWNYSTAEDDCFGDCYKTLSDFYEATYPDWHKVNAKLVIE